MHCEAVFIFGVDPETVVTSLSPRTIRADVIVESKCARFDSGPHYYPLDHVNFAMNTEITKTGKLPHLITALVLKRESI